MLFIKEEFVDTKGVIKINENYVKKKFVRSYGSVIYNYLLHDVVSSNLDQGKVSTLCDQVCQWRVTGQWFSLGPPVSSINKTDCHNKAETLLKHHQNKQKYNLLHFVLKLLIYKIIYTWFRYMLHIINGLIDWPKFVKIMRNSFCQWLMQSVN